MKMTGTNYRISTEGIRPLKRTTDKTVTTTQMYIQCNYIKKELIEHFSEHLNVAVWYQKSIIDKESVKAYIIDKVDKLKTHDKVLVIYNLIYNDMDYKQAMDKL